MEGGAYFGGSGEASDWIEIGRRRMRHQIERYVEAIRQQSGGRYEHVWPLDTEGAFRMLAGLGYEANRKHYDYCIRHGHMEAPAKEGKMCILPQRAHQHLSAIALGTTSFGFPSSAMSSTASGSRPPSADHRQ